MITITTNNDDDNPGLRVTDRIPSLVFIVQSNVADPQVRASPMHPYAKAKAIARVYVFPNAMPSRVHQHHHRSWRTACCSSCSPSASSSWPSSAKRTLTPLSWGWCVYIPVVGGVFSCCKMLLRSYLLTHTHARNNTHRWARSWSGRSGWSRRRCGTGRKLCWGTLCTTGACDTCMMCAAGGPAGARGWDTSFYQPTGKTGRSRRRRRSRR